MQFLSMESWLIAVCVVVPIAVIVLAVVIWYITTRNRLVALNNDVDESFSAMDIHMKKRYDLIPNLVETCKGYTKHEHETLARVTEARNNAMRAAPADRPQAEKELSSSLRVLFNKVHEAYPELKANGQFNNLSSQLEQIEHEIAQSRKYYNAKIKLLNNKIQQFPSCIIAKRMGFERKAYYELDDVTERQTPKVSF